MVNQRQVFIATSNEFGRDLKSNFTIPNALSQLIEMTSQIQLPTSATTATFDDTTP